MRHVKECVLHHIIGLGRLGKKVGGHLRQHVFAAHDLAAVQHTVYYLRFVHNLTQPVAAVFQRFLAAGLKSVLILCFQLAGVPKGTPGHLIAHLSTPGTYFAHFIQGVALPGQYVLHRLADVGFKIAPAFPKRDGAVVLGAVHALFQMPYVVGQGLCKILRIYYGRCAQVSCRLLDCHTQVRPHFCNLPVAGQTLGQAGIACAARRGTHSVDVLHQRREICFATAAADAFDLLLRAHLYTIVPVVPLHGVTQRDRPGVVGGHVGNMIRPGIKRIPQQNTVVGKLRQVLCKSLVLDGPQSGVSAHVGIACTGLVSVTLERPVVLFIKLVKAVLLLGDLIAPTRRAVLGTQIIAHGLCHLHLLVCQCAGNICKVCRGQVPHAGAGLLAVLVNQGEAAYHQVVVRLLTLAQVVQLYHLAYRHVDLLPVFQCKVVLLRFAASPLGDVSIATDLFKLFLC